MNDIIFWLTVKKMFLFFPDYQKIVHFIYYFKNSVIFLACTFLNFMWWNKIYHISLILWRPGLKKVENWCITGFKTYFLKINGIFFYNALKRLAKRMFCHPSLLCYIFLCNFLPSLFCPVFMFSSVVALPQSQWNCFH